MENDTLLAQRRPAVQRAYRPEPVRFVGRVSYGLVAEIGTERYPVLADAVTKSRGRVLEWASDQIGLTDLAGASLSEPLDVADMPGFKFGVAVSPDGATWVARMERPDRDVPQRAWTTEASVVTLEDSALFAVRNTCSAPSGPMAVPRSVPNFVKKVAKLVGLYDADEAITDVEWNIESEDDVFVGKRGPLKSNPAVCDGIIQTLQFPMRQNHAIYKARTLRSARFTSVRVDRALTIYLTALQTSFGAWLRTSTYQLAVKRAERRARAQTGVK